jgi:hypothetical protein
MTTAPGVQYFAIEGCAKSFFRCDTLRSTLSSDACAANWRRAQRLRPDQVTAVHRCRQCPVGAAHAGEKIIVRSPLFGSDWCPRCRKFAGRMIGGTRCISCYNREREFIVGRNAKGTAPQFRFDPRRIGVVIDGARVDLREGHTADALELALAVLRIAPGRIMFTRARGGPAITVGELAKRYREKPTSTPGGAAVAGYMQRRAAAGLSVGRRAS